MLETKAQDTATTPPLRERPITVSVFYKIKLRWDSKLV